jgi:hypothetical protein
MAAISMQSYFHLFFIPTLPMGKSASAHCGNCGNSMGVAVPPSVSTPLWSFAGAGIVGTIAAIGVVSSAVQQASTRSASAATDMPAATPATATTPPSPPPAARTKHR